MNSAIGAPKSSRTGETKAARAPMKTGTANAQAAAAKRSSRAIRSEGGVATRGSSHEISHRQPGRENWRSVLSSAIPKQLSVPSHTHPRAVAHGEMSPINRAKERRHEMDMRKAVIAALAGGSMLAGVALGAAFAAGSGSSANAATTTTNSNTRADASASPGAFVSNEDPVHDAGESADREAQEGAGQG